MAIEVRMPALSPTMEKGTLAKWLIQPGDMVKEGDLIAEIETDKATMELEASDEGVLAQIVVPDGTEDVAVGTVLALLGKAGEAKPELVVTEVVAPAPARADPVPPQQPIAKSAPRADQVPGSEGAPPVAPALDDAVSATPLVKRIAAVEGITLSAIKGSGPRGKIVKADLGLAPLIAPVPPAAEPSPAPTNAPPPQGVPVETIKLSSMRKTIARRLTESKQQVPHFYLTARCNLDPLLKLRERINSDLENRGIKISVNDLLIKALALALVAVPEANVQFGGEVLHRFGEVDIAVAVALDDGLITPVLRDVASLSLSAIAQQAKQLADKAREGKLAPEDYQGGTASLSNLGMFGIDEMFPVINPPHALILGTAAGIRQPWNVDGEMALATVMAATGSFDHRAIDGAVAARFMAAFKEMVENPFSMLA
jgi:pyruvate dehydrogenase E2 component (dihydrolipoamide acetyltransferase)